MLADGGDEGVEVVWVAGKNEGAIDVDKDVDGFFGLCVVE